MEKFNVKCSDHFPMKCNLSKADKDYLMTPEQFKAFLIFQYKNQDVLKYTTTNAYFDNKVIPLPNPAV